jgi:toxin ParE1/3/4
MRKIRLLDEAVIEAMEATSWYEQERASLGIEFTEALDAALDLLENEIVPLTAMPGEPGLHGFKRLILFRFPFDVVVLIRGDEMLIVAVAHQAR